MSDLIVLKTKSKEEELNKLQEELLGEYYEYMNELSDEIDQVLSIIYTKNGQLLVSSNGVDAKTALWMTEEFKLNSLMGTFSDYEAK